MKNNRREFIRKGALSGAGLLGMGLASGEAKATVAKKNARQADSTREIIRTGFIGVGSRGRSHLNDSAGISGVEIAAICDINPVSLEKARKLLKDKGKDSPVEYTGDDYAFLTMLRQEELDAVIIATPWEWHVPMSVASMRAGVPYTGVEVSAANTLEECWDLVNVHEETGNELMILENVCYRRDVMAVLNMVRQGLFGELIHCRCGYEHDLRGVKFNDGANYSYREGGSIKTGKEAYAEAYWRTLHSIRRNGDLYPTHGVGPIANYLEINRGNRFLSISSMATKSRGLQHFVRSKGGQDHPLANIHFNLGDIVTSMLRCANGETVIVTHDTNLPRPYSLGFRVEGTGGLWYNDGDTLYIEGKSKSPDEWDPAGEWTAKYDHQMWRDFGKMAEGGGHGGMDYIMLLDFFRAVRDNLPVPLDAYDAASWSAVSALSEMSVARGGALVDFPDFTRGQWIKREPAFALDGLFPLSPSQAFLHNLF